MKLTIKIMIITLCLLTSCVGMKKRRANRKINKAMQLDPSRFANDTIILVDTVYTETITHDTVTNFVHHDTVTVVNNEKTILKYFYDTTHKEIWHEVECKGDTVTLTNEVIVEKITQRSIKDIVSEYIIGLVAVAIGLMIFGYLAGVKE